MSVPAAAGRARRRAEALAALDALLADPHPAARAVGRAVRDASLEPAAEAAAWVERIETLRGELESREDEVVIAYPGSRSRREAVGQVTHQRSNREPWGRFLYHLVRELRPARCLEMGTCVGVSTSYQAAALAENRAGEIVTLEGAAALSELARENLDRLGLLDRARLVMGRFRDTLAPTLDQLEPVDYAFVDGHHDEAATLGYFDRIAERLAPGAVVVFDDIAWSDGMARAWEAIAGDPRVIAAIDLATIGVVVAEPAGAVDGDVAPGPRRPRFYRLDDVTRLDLADYAGAARREIVSAVPEHATVLVVSRGDEELIDLPGREARHFPGDASGRWAGHHPSDGGEAIELLERARADGAEFLAFPAASAWWLDHYVELRRHLDTRYRIVPLQGAAVVYDVRGR